MFQIARWLAIRASEIGIPNDAVLSSANAMSRDFRVRIVQVDGVLEGKCCFGSFGIGNHPFENHAPLIATHSLFLGFHVLFYDPSDHVDGLVTLGLIVSGQR